MLLQLNYHCRHIMTGRIFLPETFIAFQGMIIHLRFLNPTSIEIVCNIPTDAKHKLCYQMKVYYTIITFNKQFLLLKANLH